MKEAQRLLSKKHSKVPGKCSMQHNSIMREQELEALKGMKTLLFVSFLCFAFMAGEFVGGLLSHSLAIMTDAAH